VGGFEGKLPVASKLRSVSGIAHDFNNLLAAIVGCAPFVPADLAAHSYQDFLPCTRTARAHGSVRRTVSAGRTVSVRCTALCQKMPSPLVFAVVGIHTLHTSTIGADQSARSAQAVLVIGQPSGFSSCWPTALTSVVGAGILDQGLWPVVCLNGETG
jgi:hypothetical protein